MRRWVIGLIILALLGVGLVGWRSLPRPRPSSAEQAWITPTGGSIVQEIQASGTVQARRQAGLSFPMGGQVRAIHIQKGVSVQKGDLLAELDNKAQELSFLRSRSAYEISRIDGSPNSLREREIDMQIAQSELEKTRLRAPFSGVVADLMVEEGEQIGSSTVVVQLLDNSQFYAEVSVDELDIGRIRLGQVATLRVNALPEQRITGVVTDIGLRAQSAGSLVTVPVKIRIDEAFTHLLKPGYTTSVRIEVGRVENALILPLEALVSRDGKQWVTVLKDGVQTLTPVVTGLSNGREIQIVSGLAPEDRVVRLNYRQPNSQGGPRTIFGIRI